MQFNLVLKHTSENTILILNNFSSTIGNLFSDKSGTFSGKIGNFFPKKSEFFFSRQKIGKFFLEKIGNFSPKKKPETFFWKNWEIFFRIY
jgi:hypothetical protein